MHTTIKIVKLNDNQIKQLAFILIDIVKTGASVGYLDNLTYSEAIIYWESVNKNLDENNLLWIAYNNEIIVGTVQLTICNKPNGKHRGEVNKLLVVPMYQGQKNSSKLMLTLETYAKQNALKLLTLDTQTNSMAEKIYIHLGWQKIGEIPYYAKNIFGELSSTSYFYKVV